MVLLAHIKEQSRLTLGSYGRPRMTEDAKRGGKLRWRSSNTTMASTIRGGDTQHWVGKAPSLSNRKWPKRALGAARKRDRSNRMQDNPYIPWNTNH